ncbi:MAG: cupin domain-containing protein [Geminicoccaceae bacterium]
MTFDEIVAPLDAAAFHRDYLGQRPLHLQGDPLKWDRVMNWELLNRLLAMNTIWSAASLLLVLDKEQLPVTAYASVASGRDGGQVLRPDPVRVRAFLKRGATLVLNDIDQLTPDLSAFARAMERALGGKVQANLYMSSKRKQGFRVHFDYHDVFAVHVMGEKTWMVYEGREESPITHPRFTSLTQEYKDKAKGELWKEVRMRPGDLLYLPRGQYHYALADDSPCAHIAFGVTYPIGVDVVSWLFEQTVAEPLGRQNLPRGDAKALAARLADIGDWIAGLLRESKAVEALAAFERNFHWQRETYDLPGLIESADEQWHVRRRGMKLVEQGGRFGLTKEGTRQAVEVPGAIVPLVKWTLQRDGFARQEIATAFSDQSEQVDRFIADMARMGLLEAASSGG